MFRSNNIDVTAVELNFIQFWTPFVRIFQCCGASHFGIFRPPLHTQRIKCDWLCMIFFGQIIFTVACVYFHSQMEMAISIYSIESTSSIFAYVNYISYYSYFASNFLFPFETFAMRHTERRIYDTLHNIDAIFRHFNHVVDYRTHRRRQIVNILLCFVGPMALTFYGLCIAFPLKLTHSSVAGISIFVYLNVVWRTRLAQIAMHINALCDLLGELKVLMQRHKHAIKYNSAAWRNIQSDRRIYTHIWQLKTLIGDCFGFSLILFVIGSALKVVTCSYWLFLNVELLRLRNLYTRGSFQQILFPSWHAIHPNIYAVFHFRGFCFRHALLNNAILLLSHFESVPANGWCNRNNINRSSSFES